MADVVRTFEPDADVRQGEWVTGPDGERELDVVITGSFDGTPRTILIECKDYNPTGTGPVGIAHVDALDSKRDDLQVDAALLCTNAGFTKPAIRKATRVGIGLLGVMKQADTRIRFLVSESLYTRKMKVLELGIGLHYQGTQLELGGIPFDSVLYADRQVGNWVTTRAMMILGHNPIVNGRFTATHALKAPIEFALPDGPATADQIDFTLAVTGSWYVQDVKYDATAGFYDWLRRRVRLAPNPDGFQFHIKDVNVHAGEPVERPPETVLSYDLRPGEVSLTLMVVDGCAEPGTAPELDSLIEPADLDFVIPDLPTDACTSSGDFSPGV